MCGWDGVGWETPMLDESCPPIEVVVLKCGKVLFMKSYRQQYYKPQCTNLYICFIDMHIYTSLVEAKWWVANGGGRTLGE